MRPSSIGLVGSLVLSMLPRPGALVQLNPRPGKGWMKRRAQLLEGARRGRRGASCLWCSARRTRSDERDRPEQGGDDHDATWTPLGLCESLCPHRLAPDVAALAARRSCVRAGAPGPLR